MTKEEKSKSWDEWEYTLAGMKIPKGGIKEETKHPLIIISTLMLFVILLILVVGYYSEASNFKEVMTKACNNQNTTYFGLITTNETNVIVMCREGGYSYSFNLELT